MCTYLWAIHAHDVVYWKQILWVWEGFKNVSYDKDVWNNKNQSFSWRYYTLMRWIIEIKIRYIYKKYVKLK